MASLDCLTSDAPQTEEGPARGRVWLLDDNPRDVEIVFDFPFHEELNDAVKRLPKRWFNWRRKHWRVPADPRLAKSVERLLERFPGLEPTPEVLAWLADSDRWRAAVSVVSYRGAGAFILRTLAGEAPPELSEAADDAEGRHLLPFSMESADLLYDLDGVQLDDLARGCARELSAGRKPAPAELSIEVGDDGEPEVTIFTIWDPQPARDFRKLPEAHPIARPGRFYVRDASWGIAVPADAALASDLTDFVEANPKIHLDERVTGMLAELVAEHERAAATVALSYAEDADLDGLELGGVLHPFQRAGVRYALERRRTFIADEQGLGKTVQALAALERDDAFPAAVVCPASMKLTWERETHIWLPNRTVAVLDGRTDGSWAGDAEDADIVVLNYDILEAHLAKLAGRGLRALILDESHYVKNPRARRTKAALELAERLPTDALRFGLTGTPILNRPEELVAQLRILGRLQDFGSGARLTRRFRAAGSDDRLHWNLRANCYVRRTKKQVLPQLPSKRQDTIPVALLNEQEYRLAEQDVISWLQTLPLDMRAIDAKVAAALRAEQLVRLNNLRQLAARGKLPGRAELDRGLRGLRRAAGGVRRARGDPARGDGALPRRGAHPGRRLHGQAPAGGGRLPARGRPAADRVLDEGGVAGNHPDPGVERGLPGARLDPGPARPGRGPPAPHRPGQRRDGVLPAGPGHDRRDHGRGPPAQARADQRGDGRPGAGRGAPRGRRGAGAARQAGAAFARRGLRALRRGPPFSGSRVPRAVPMR